MTFLLYLLSVATLLGAPGPTNALLAVAGARRGFVASLPLLAAVLCGYALAISAIHLFFQPLQEAFPKAASGFKIAFAAYVIFLSIKLWRGMKGRGGQDEALGWRQLFMATLLNPKAFGFALVLIPFDRPDLLLYLAGFAVCLVLTGSLWMAAGAWVSSSGGAQGQSLVGKTASVVMALFAGVILVSALKA